MQAMLKTAEKRWEPLDVWKHLQRFHTTDISYRCSHTSTTMKHSEAAVLTVADLADLFTDDTEHLE